MRRVQSNHKLFKYYSTQRPIDIGTIPMGHDVPLYEVINYNQGKRIPVKGEAFSAWGEIIYAGPLTKSQYQAYELQPSRYNPDLWKIVNIQAHVVGEWETDGNINVGKRITSWCSDSGTYMLDESHSIYELAERYRLFQKYDHVRKMNPDSCPEPSAVV